MILIDKLSYSSKLRYTNSTLKVFFCLSNMLICVITGSITLSLIMIVVMGSVSVIIGGTSPTYYVKLYKIPLLFLLLGTLSIIINYSDHLSNSLIEIPFLNNYLIISKSSILLAAKLITTALGSLSCLYFLALSTPMIDLLLVMKKIRCPFLIIELMMLIYRFIFILLDLSNSISIAQKSRLGNINFRTSCKSAGQLITILLVRSFQKSTMLFDSLESRCYDGKINVLEEYQKPNIRLVIIVFLFELIMILLFIEHVKGLII